MVGFRASPPCDNPTLGIVQPDDDLLRYIVNVHAVLLTRGIRGTVEYVVGPGLRAHRRTFFR